MLLYLVPIALGAWLMLVQWKGRRIRSAAKQFPNDIRAWPLIGHMHYWRGSDEVSRPNGHFYTSESTSALQEETTAEKMRRKKLNNRMEAFKMLGLEAIKQGGVTNLWLGIEPYITLCDPVVAEVLLKACLEKDQSSMRFTRTVTGDGLIFAPVSIWRPRRKTLAPIFSLKNLNRFVQVFAKQSDVMVQQLEPAANGRDFSIWKYITTFTFDSVCGTTLGIQMNTQTQKNHPFLDAFEDCCAIVAKRIMQPWLHPDLVFRLLPQFKRCQSDIQLMFEFVNKIIQMKRQELVSERNGDTEKISDVENDEMKSFLEMLIEASGGEMGYSDVELREEVLVIILAGTDTSAVGASFATVMLSRYQEEQDKVYEEIREVFGDSDRPLQPEDLPRLKYLELFLKETLRLYPPVPVTVREVHNDCTLPSGKTVVAGMKIILHIWGMHRNQRYWGADAEQFRPERFLQPLQHPAQFVPFSYGMRNCLGYQYAMMSMKTAVASLVRRYRVLPPSELAPTQLHAPLRVKYDIMMKHVDDFVVRLQPRH